MRMDSSILSIEEDAGGKRFSKSEVLEMSYKEAVHGAEAIVKDENGRRLRLQILMLENENDDLTEQLGKADDQIDALALESDEMRAQLENAQVNASRQENDLKSQARELINIKAELDSMNSVNADSAKLLTEKLSLSRELSTLKPEVEYLRSQALQHQSVLAEKLALQRQVSTLEVELETEKRASKRAAQKNLNKEQEIELQNQVEELQKEIAKEKRQAEKARKQQEKDFQNQLDELSREHSEGEKIRRELQSKLEELQQDIAVEKRDASKKMKEAGRDTQSRLEDLERDLAREKREAEKSRKDMEKELAAAESKHTVLESKIEQWREKCRSFKDQLKECKAELDEARTAAAKASLVAKTEKAPKNPRKRAALEMSADANIGTPDGAVMRNKRPGMKRGRMDQTILGEKSMFSITPFLNRTVMAPESPENKSEAEEEEGEEENVPVVKAKPAKLAPIEKALPAESLVEENELENSTPSQPPKTKGRKKAIEQSLPTERAPLSEAKSTAKNKKPAGKRPVLKKPKAMTTLAKVMEEEGDENEPIDPAPTKGDDDLAKNPVSSAPEKAVKPAKASIPEKPEPQKKKRKVLGAGKTLFDDEDGEATKRPAKLALKPARLLGKGGLAGPKGTLRGGLGNASGFADFSPLKKDRRGVGASFLA